MDYLSGDLDFITLKQIKMGFFSEIKKLLFVKKSVTKSGIEKIKDEVEETYDDVVEKGQDLRERASEKIDNLVEAFTSEDVDDTTPELESTTEAHDQVAESSDEQSSPEEKTFVEEVGSRVLDGTEELGRTVLEKADQLADKAGEIAEDVGEKVKTGSEMLKEKAKDAVDYIDKKLDETMDKARELDAELNKNDQDGDGFADEPADLTKGTLDGADDFFEKAKKFADGEPINDNATLTDVRDENIEKPNYSTYGFEDGDGDGNEIIDDAIIEEE